MLGETLREYAILLGVLQIINAVGFGSFYVRDMKMAADKYPSRMTTAIKEGYGSLFCLSTGCALLVYGIMELALC